MISTNRRVARMSSRTILLLAALLLSHGSARGETSVTTAKQHFSRGETQYRLGNFQAALAEFEAALRLVNRPSIILSMAQCHRQLGRREKALFFYRLYLSEWTRHSPSRPPLYEEEVRGHIARLERELASLKARPAGVAARPAARPALTLPPPPPPPPRARPVYKRWWFWSAIGVAVLGGTVAAIAASTGGRDWLPSGPSYTPDSFPNR